MIRPATTRDAGELAAIYNHYVERTHVTFEKVAVSVAEMKGRIAKQTDSCPWLTAEVGGALAGYAYASPWSTRAGYSSSVETTVYIAQDQRRKGLGMALYDSLIARLNSAGLHSAIGVIALPNPASIALHEKLGFQKVGELREIGWKCDRWVNVGYWQRLF